MQRVEHYSLRRRLCDGAPCDRYKRCRQFAASALDRSLICRPKGSVGQVEILCKRLERTDCRVRRLGHDGVVPDGERARAVGRGTDVRAIDAQLGTRRCRLDRERARAAAQLAQAQHLGTPGVGGGGALTSSPLDPRYNSRAI